MSDTGYPTFERPPVVEVGLVAQFAEPLAWGHEDTLAAAWPRFRRETRPVLSRLDLLPYNVGDVAEGAAEQRLWLENATGSRVVQMQPDRLMANWSDDDPDEEYPRYEHIRGFFIDAWERMENVVAAPLQPDICEVFYLNYITPKNGWRGYEDTAAVVAPWGGDMSNNFLGTPQFTATTLHFHLPDPCQWLNIEIGPIEVDDQQLLVIYLGARGLAATPDLQGALAVFDVAHEWIVKGFVSVTTEQAHDEWGLTR